MSNNAAIPKYSIVHVVDRLHTGGAERVLVTLANIFYEHGHKVKVVTIAEQGPLSAQLLPGIEQVNLGRKFKFDPFIMRRLVKETRGFDVVHVHSFFNLRYLWLAKMLFGLRRPVFYHEHLGLRAVMQPTADQKYILPKTIFIATTEAIKVWATELGKMPGKNVFALPNIIIKERVKPVEKKNEEIVKLVLVSNISDKKNIKFGITLLQELNKPFLKYHLTIIGKVYDKEYYKGVVTLIGHQQGTTPATTFIHDADSVQQLLQQFDIGLHSSPSESGPLAVIEYMAQGLPFVAYNTGEVITTIKDELPGCIAYSFDNSEWINKIQQLLQADTTVLKQQLQSVFDKHFSVEGYYQQCLAIYAEGLAP